MWCRAAWLGVLGRVAERFGARLGAELGARALRLLLGARDAQPPLAAQRWACLLQLMHHVPVSNRSHYVVLLLSYTVNTHILYSENNVNSKKIFADHRTFSLTIGESDCSLKGLGIDSRVGPLLSFFHEKLSIASRSMEDGGFSAHASENTLR